MPLNDDIIAAAVQRYGRETDRYSKLAALVAEKCQKGIVEGNAIRATVSWRTKTPRKLEGKLRRYLKDAEGAQRLDTVDEVFDRIGDLSGVRISTYVERDRQLVVEEIKKVFDGPNEGSVEVDEKDKVKEEGSNFYRATHCQVILKPDDLIETYKNLEGVSCEIQVCSLLAHVWNEIEHDLTYKPETGQLSSKEKELLEEIGHLTTAGDTAVLHLFEATDERRKKLEGTFEDVYDFVARMRESFPGVKQFSTNVGELFDEVQHSELDTPARLREELLSEDGAVAQGKSLLESLKQSMGPDELVDIDPDPDTSDILLMLLLGKRVDEVLENHPMGRGKGRPLRIARIASRFKKLQKDSADPPGGQTNGGASAP